MAEAHPFLSDEWIAAARRIREEYRGEAQTGGHVIKMNQVITDVPFGDGIMHTHMDTTSGEPEMGMGHVADADVTVILDYETAKAVFVGGDPQAGLQAFMAGKIKVQGDMAKLLVMQQAAPDPRAAEAQRRIREITS